MSEALTTAPDSQSAVSIIQMALSSGASPETLRELLAVRREWEADEGRKQFHRSLAAFQSRAPIIEKGDMAHDKAYARMDRIWRSVKPLTSELGLSVTWQKCELRDGGYCHVEGTLGHEQGHCVPLAIDVPLPALIRGQNVAQQMGSAITYAQRYAFCGALGVVIGDDDDGNAAAAQGDSPAHRRMERVRSMTAANRDAAKEPEHVAFTDVPDTITGPLQDFLLMVSEAKTAEDLTGLTEQGREFTAEAQAKLARGAVMRRASELHVKWNRNTNQYNPA